MDEEFDEKEKSEIGQALKKGISKTIKTMPLKTKLIIIGVIFGIVFTLLIFISLLAPLIILFGDDESTSSGSSYSYLDINSVDNFWWPIGGTEITTENGIDFAIGDPSTTYVTSPFTNARTFDGGKTYEAHHGMDISWSGTHYVIASSRGKVYGVHTGCDNNGSLSSSCNGGYGNYIVIEHANNIYTIYAHLQPNSITLNTGDEVKQGQVIGIMGNSGRSTGQHLHFQVEVGARSSDNAVDPLNYVSATNPRPVTVTTDTASSNLLTMLQSWEGTGPMADGKYVVYDDGTGTLTVGHGVTIIYNADKFKKLGIDPGSITKGTKIATYIVDTIESEIIAEKRASVVSLLNQNSITLEEYQIDALVIRIYNVGNINAFPSNYKQYGNTQELYDNYMSKPVTGGGVYMEGLARRRAAEWKLFHEGIYQLNN